MPETLLNYIDGRWSPAKGKRRLEDRNPAHTDELVATFNASNAEDVDDAVCAAERAFESWRLVPAPERGAIIRRAGLLIQEKKSALAELMTREMGKVLKETEGDVQEGIDTAYHVASEGRRLFGETTTSELPNRFAMSVRMPVGVCGLITPWNFPLAIPTWKIFPALICGNTVVFKPAEDTPAVAVEFVKIMEKAGIPKGVLNLVLGDGETGKAIVRHEKVRLISFTGSTEAGRDVAEHCGRSLKRVSLEMGGKNAQIVMADADLNLALEGGLWGAFGTTGQRCTATSRIILHEKIFDEFKKKFIARAQSLKIGSGLDRSVDIGPLINSIQRERVHEYVKIGIGEGAKLECGGDFAKGKGLEKGFFYQPTVFSNVDSGMRIAQEEIFGPVTVLMKVKSFEEAVKVLNGTNYGLSSSIYTQNVNEAFRAIRDLEAGITYINGPTIGAEVHLPFGGVKNTGNGHREAGTAVYDIFTEWKSVFTDYSGQLQKAQIDTRNS